MIVKVTSNKAFPCSVISIQDVLVSSLPFHALPVDSSPPASRGDGPGACICFSTPPL